MFLKDRLLTLLESVVESTECNCPVSACDKTCVHGEAATLYRELQDAELITKAERKEEIASEWERTKKRINWQSTLLAWAIVIPIVAGAIGLFAWLMK